MKFSCKDNHIYKKFLEMILMFDEAKTIIQDYLDYVDVIDFDNRKENSKNEISLKSSDLVELQEILESEEFKKLMVNRFVDALKDLLLRQSKYNYQATLLLGEYRELLNDEVKYVTITEEEIVYKPDDITIMERVLGNSITNMRNDAFEIICENIGPCKKESSAKNSDINGFTKENTHPSVTRTNDEGDKNRGISSRTFSGSNRDERSLLDLITFDKNSISEYKKSMNQWEEISSYIKQLTETADTENSLEALRQSIRWLHRSISGVKISTVSRWNDLEKTLTLNQTKLDSNEQKRLQTNFYKVLSERKYTNVITDNAQNIDLIEYRAKLKKRLTTTKSQRAKYIDKEESSKLQFNLNEALRLLLYIETEVIFKSNITTGRLDIDKDSNIIISYLNMIQDLESYLNVFNAKTDNQKTLNKIKSIVMQDLFSRSKFDAMHLFTMMNKNMEETLSYLLNSTHHNYSSLAVPTLVRNFTKLFDEFLKENHNLNRSITEQHVPANPGFPNIHEIEQKYAIVLNRKKILEKFEQKYPISTPTINEGIINVHNNSNLYNKHK